MRTYQQQPRRRQPVASSRCARRAGFSFIELVVVLMIMSILAAAAVPTFFDSLQFHRVETAARRVKADLELLRSTARLTSRAQTFAFTGTPDNAEYEAVFGSDLYDLDRSSAPYSVQLWKPPYEIDSVTLENAGGNSRISFDGFGVPSTVDANGVRTAVDDRTDIQLQSGDFECTVSIHSCGEVTKGDTVAP